MERLGMNPDPRKPVLPVLPEEAKNLTDWSSAMEEQDLFIGWRRDQTGQLQI